MKTTIQPTHRGIPLLVLAAGLIILMPFAANAQELATFTNNNQTITVTGSNTISTSYQVASTNFNNGSLIVTNGGIITQSGNSKSLAIGFTTGLGVDVTSNNLLLVSGSGSSVSSTNNYFGVAGLRNRLIVENGAHLSAGNFGATVSGRSNSITVTGAGSLLRLSSLNFNSTFNSSLSLLDGARWSNSLVRIGNSGSSNTVTVSGAGSTLQNREIIIGTTDTLRSGNALIVGVGGTANVASNVIVRGQVGATGNRVVMDGGTLTLTNSAGAIDLQRGALILNSGTVNTKRLLATNGSASVVTFNGGRLNTEGSTIATGIAFTVGNGTSVAELSLVSGNHSFADGLAVASNATLSGAGSVTNGSVSIASGGTIAPGNSIGTLTVGALSLADGANMVFELTSTNAYDRIIGTSLTLAGGTVNLTLAGFGTQSIALNDRFTLFNGSVTGFTNTTFNIINNTDWAGGWEISEGSLVVTAVPEPSTYALLVLSAVGLGAHVVRRRRRRHNTGVSPR